LLHQHGNIGIVAPVFFSGGPSGEAAAQAWIDSETYSTKAGMYRCYDSSRMRWLVVVETNWFKLNWKAEQDERKAITAMLGCHGAEPSPTSPDSLMANVGGRVVLAYTGLTDTSQHQPNMATFFTRLAGTYDSRWNGRRTAGEAWNGGSGYSSNLRMIGNDWTTLEPAVQFCGKTGFHEDKGAATIAFDTYMDSSVSADTAVEITAGSGSARRWFAPIEATSLKPRIYGISCDLTGPTAASLKAVAANCLNEHITGADGRKMTSTGGTYGQDETW